jgi:hypothetical protein
MNDIIETETMPREPILAHGGWIETKNGQQCVRMPDTVQFQSTAGYIVQRRWRPVADTINGTRVTDLDGNQTNFIK